MAEMRRKIIQKAWHGMACLFRCHPLGTVFMAHTHAHTRTLSPCLFPHISFFLREERAVDGWFEKGWDGMTDGLTN